MAGSSHHLDAVIIGGGFAGAATAWWLKHRGVDRIKVLEQEDMPGVHASGRNAGIARQGVPEPPTSLLAALGTFFLRHPPPGFCPTALLEPAGGFLLSTVADDPRLDEIQRNAMAAGVHTYPASRPEVLDKVPSLTESPFRSALACPHDGLADIHALLTSYLAPVEVETSAKVTGFQVDKHKITAVETSKGTLHAHWVVNAAGAWAGEVARLADASPLAITPRRRHLLHTGPLDGAGTPAPYVWCLHPAVYFRTESRGLLLSPCDEATWKPGSPPADPDASAWLAERLSSTFPHLANLPIARMWAGLRSFSDDGNFVIGRDPKVSNFLWVAGLGGHGMTTSAAVGELAAALLLGRVPPLDPAPYSPARFK